jgi:uncharacterized protein YybS (DUF2232 family)
LTEGAVLAAIVAVLAVAARYFPLLDTAAVLLCPLPLTILTVRYGLRVALLAAVVAASIGTMVGGVLIGVGIAVAFAPPGIAMGIGIRRHFSATRIWLLTAGVVMASVVAITGLALLGIGIDPRQEIVRVVQMSAQSRQMVLQLYERLGMNPASVRMAAQGMQQMQQAMEMLPRLLPLLLVGAGASTAYINLVVGRSVLRRVGVDVPAFPPLSTWRVPSWFLWALPAGMLSSWVSDAGGPPIPLSTLRLLPPDDVASLAVRYPLLAATGTNLVWLALGVFSLLGLITGWVLMERFRIPRWYRWVLIYLAMFSPALNFASLLLGVADSSFGLRSRWRVVSPPQIPARGPVVKGQ